MNKEQIKKEFRNWALRTLELGSERPTHAEINEALEKMRASGDSQKKQNAELSTRMLVREAYLNELVDAASTQVTQAYIDLGMNPDDPRSHNEAEIKRVYRNRMLQLHPDRLRPDQRTAEANKQPQKVIEAYGLLTDVEKLINKAQENTPPAQTTNPNQHHQQQQAHQRAASSAAGAAAASSSSQDSQSRAGIKMTISITTPTQKSDFLIGWAKDVLGLSKSQPTPSEQEIIGVMNRTEKTSRVTPEEREFMRRAYAILKNEDYRDLVVNQMADINFQYQSSTNDKQISGQQALSKVYLQMVQPTLLRLDPDEEPSSRTGASPGSP